MLPEWLLLAVAGLGAGFVSGLLGVGGGIVMVPVLHYLLGIPFAEATALSLFAIMVNAPVGLWQHHRKRSVDFRIGGWLVAGGAGGVILGRFLQPVLSVMWLKVLFGALMLFAAYRLLARLRSRNGTPVHAGWLVGLGFAAGVISRLLGVGGGILTVPVLVLMGVPVHLAVGSSLLPVWTNAMVASGWALVDGLDWQYAIPLALMAVVGAPLGVKAAHALPDIGLRRVVAGAMAVVGVLIMATSGLETGP